MHTVHYYMTYRSKSWFWWLTFYHRNVTGSNIGISRCPVPVGSSCPMAQSTARVSFWTIMGSKVPVEPYCASFRNLPTYCKTVISFWCIFLVHLHLCWDYYILTFAWTAYWLVFTWIVWHFMTKWSTLMPKIKFAENHHAFLKNLL